MNSRAQFAALTLALIALGVAFTKPALADAVDKGGIEKCSQSLGSLAVVEPQSEMLAALQQYRLGSPATMLRMIVQESGCFTVVERGVAMQNLQQERALAAAGQMQQGSNIGGGQLQAADFVMTPSVQFTGDTGGVGAAVGGLLGRFGGGWGALGGLAGGVKFKEAETTLLVADVRSGIQVASAEGQASKMDFSIGGWGWGGMGWASAGGYSKTPEGKMIAASLLDNYNKIVQTVRDRPQLIQTTSVASKKNAANSIQATMPDQPSYARPSANNAASGLAGMYSVKYIGDDQGSVNVMISKNGNVSGMGVSSKYKINFNVSGTVTPDGEMMLTGQGKAGGAKFMGSIDQQNGTVVGMWQWGGNTSGQGTFNGSKQ